MESLVSTAAAFFRGRRVLVTGAAGFIGRRLSEVLAVAGANLSILEIPSADLTPLHALSKQGLAIQYLSADLCNREQVTECVQSSQPEFVFHLAAAGVGNPFLPLERALAVNLHGSVNLFQACFQAGSGTAPLRLVHTGTPYEYGNGRSDEPSPINPLCGLQSGCFCRRPHVSAYPSMAYRHRAAVPGLRPRPACSFAHSGRFDRCTGRQTL